MGPFGSWFGMIWEGRGGSGGPPPRLILQRAALSVMVDVDPKELLAELGSLVEELKVCLISGAVGRTPRPLRQAFTTSSLSRSQVVSYRWLARHFNVPANLSKRVLAQYAEQHKGRVKTTYLVSGWLKVRRGQGRLSCASTALLRQEPHAHAAWTPQEGLQHVVKVVDGQHVDGEEEGTDPGAWA